MFVYTPQIHLSNNCKSSLKPTILHPDLLVNMKESSWHSLTPHLPPSLILPPQTFCLSPKEELPLLPGACQAEIEVGCLHKWVAKKVGWKGLVSEAFPWQFHDHNFTCNRTDASHVFSFLYSFLLASPYHRLLHSFIHSYIHSLF